MLVTKYRLLPALSLLMLAACGGKDKQKTAPAGAGRGPAAVNVFVLKTSALSETVEVPGTLIANESTDIYPEMAGRVIQLNIAEGKQVTKGALLVKLFDGDLQATLRKLQVQLEIAKQNEDRSAQLLKIQGISKADYDIAALNVNNIQADIAITRANITKTEIRAPFTGRVGLKNISPGAYVSPATVIASIQQTSTLKLDFTVPEKYTSRIKVGQLVHFTTESTGKTYTAKVMATESGVTLDTRSLTARCIVQEKDPQLVPGSFAKVKLDFDPVPDAIMVPSQAIVPQARGKQVILFNGGTAKFVDVNTGLRDSASVQITSGVNAGDTIVISGLMSTKPGTKIKIGKIVNADGSTTQVTKDTTVKTQQPAK